MRVFIGIRPDGDALERLEETVVSLRRDFHSLNWVAPDNRHLTLRFLGEIPADRAKEIARRLTADPPPPGPCRLVITGLGTFSGRSGIRVVWAGLENAPCLRRLFDWMEDRLALLDIPREERPFQPHITLARNRHSASPPSLQERLRSAASRRIAEFAVPGITAFSSRLTPRGPVYSVLQEIRLGHA